MSRPVEAARATIEAELGGLEAVGEDADANAALMRVARDFTGWLAVQAWGPREKWFRQSWLSVTGADSGETT